MILIVGGDLSKYWRRDPESNRATWICNPVHNRFAIAPNIANQCFKLERETRLKLATPTLARTCSTNLAIPPESDALFIQNKFFVKHFFNYLCLIIKYLIDCLIFSQ